MVAIRLARVGAKKKPSYRVVVMNKSRARDSRSIEIVGFYNPRLEPIEISLKRERIDYWLGVGAQPSDTVKRLIKYFDANGENVQAAKIGDLRAEAEAKPAKPVEKPVPAPEPAAEAKSEGEGEEAKAEEAPAEESAEEKKEEAKSE